MMCLEINQAIHKDDMMFRHILKNGVWEIAQFKTNKTTLRSKSISTPHRSTLS